MSAVAEQPVAARPPRHVLAERAAELREHGLLYEEIAERLGISRSYASELITDPDGSKARARKASYRGVCEQCGARTDGSNGRDAAPKLCAACAQERQHEQRRWTREAVVDAIRRFAAVHGRPPWSADWVSSDRVNGYPARSSVYGPARHHPFASWADAIEAAGFPRPAPGRREGDTAWTPELVLARIRRGATDGYASAKGSLHYAGVRHFGSWRAACAAAGVRPARERRAREPEAASPTRRAESSDV